MQKSIWNPNRIEKRAAAKIFPIFLISLLFHREAGRKLVQPVHFVQIVQPDH